VSSSIQHKLDERVPYIMWAYCTTVKRLHKYTLLQLVYGEKVLLLAEFIVPNTLIVQATKIYDDDSIIENLQEYGY